MREVPEWFQSAIGYQVYPQSYQDANGDGIGDLPGLIGRLDYIQSLGVTALWVNPCFASPFGDAGYDISDFRNVAPRYGTNADLVRLFREAGRRGIRVLLDLVPGHTSLEHPWFKASCRPRRNARTDRYIWTRGWWDGMGKPNFINGYCDREGSYMANFFWFQPKLNYGYLNPDPKCSWQQPMTHPACRAMKRELIGIIRYWLDRGASGYRVDSAKLIDGAGWDGVNGNTEFWSEIRSLLDRHYPEAVLISEWGWPCDALRAGFHADFLLHNMDAYKALFGHPAWRTQDKHAFFDRQPGPIAAFLDPYLQHYRAPKTRGYIAIPTSNHDCRRIADGRSADMMELVFAFQMTMPGAPFVYYGEEIGMRFVAGLVSKEGGYARTGSRTPMQWTRGRNAGFSAAPRKSLYLPTDPAADRPDVATQERDPASLLNRFRRLTALRHRFPLLQGAAPFAPVTPVSGDLPFVYERHAGARRVLVALNPAGCPRRGRIALKRGCAPNLLAGRGARLSSDGAGFDLTLASESFAIIGIGLE